MDVDLQQIRTTAVWVLVAIAVIAVVLAVVIKKIVVKLVVLAVAAVLVFVGWQQRQSVVDFADGVRGQACNQQPEFLGITVSLPDGWCNRTG
jgi:hypothetical protein